jgi:hypothetical protein
MHWDIVKIETQKDWTINIWFHDGTAGQVRFMPEFFTGVFEHCKDSQFFQKAYIDAGALAWPGEIDLAPDALYEHLKKDGKYVLR